jgi:nitrite reductase (NADH) small subunit
MTVATESATAVEITAGWHPVCRLDDLLTGRGVCALLGGHQVAVFLLWDGSVYAVGNYDPYGQAFVISRGIVGTRGNTPTIASPLYKHVFDLRTGRPLDDPDGPALPTYRVRVNGGVVEVRLL